MLILRQKSSQFCTPRLKTPQPVLPYCAMKHIVKNLILRLIWYFQVRKNVLDVSYHISQYQTIISDLRGEIGRLKEKMVFEQNSGQPGASSGTKKAELQELREHMVVNFKDQMSLRYINLNFSFFLTAGLAEAISGHRWNFVQSNFHIFIIFKDWYSKFSI